MYILCNTLHIIPLIHIVFTSVVVNSYAFQTIVQWWQIMNLQLYSTIVKSTFDTLSEMAKSSIILPMILFAIVWEIAVVLFLLLQNRVSSQYHTLSQGARIQITWYRLWWLLNKLWNGQTACFTTWTCPNSSAKQKKANHSKFTESFAL